MQYIWLLLPLHQFPTALGQRQPIANVGPLYLNIVGPNQKYFVFVMWDSGKETHNHRGGWGEGSIDKGLGILIPFCMQTKEEGKKELLRFASQSQEGKQPTGR